MRAKFSTIPEVTLRRYAKYLSFVEAMRAEGWDYVTSADVSRACNTTEMLVRKDLSHVKARGRPHVGYSTADLSTAFSAEIGWDQPRRLVFVGPRTMAQMLLTAFPFSQYNVTVTAIVERDAAEDAAVTCCGIPVINMKAFADGQGHAPVRMALLAEPVECAQTACDTLVAAGVTSVWNFSPVTLTVPDEVSVVDADLAADLAVLSHSQSRQEKGGARPA